MEMPTPCAKCGELFELLDGLTSEKWYPNIILCEPCGREEREEIERDEEISELREQIEDAEYTLRTSRARLVELGEAKADANSIKYLSEMFRIVEGATRGDTQKVQNYGRLLADKLEADGEPNSAKWLRRILDGNAGVRIVPHEVTTDVSPDTTTKDSHV